MLRNLHQLFALCTASQIIGGDFTKFCGSTIIIPVPHWLIHLFYTVFLYNRYQKLPTYKPLLGPTCLLFFGKPPTHIFLGTHAY